MDHVSEVAAMHPTATCKYADFHVSTASPDPVAGRLSKGQCHTGRIIQYILMTPKKFC